MSKSLRRRLAAAVITLTMLTVAMTAVNTATATANSYTPGDFYTPPSPLPAGQPGDIIKSAPSTYTALSGVTSTRVMYLSQDAHNQPIAVTGDILVPTAPWTGSGRRPIVAYAPFTFGTGPQCVPSKTFAGDSGSGDLLSGVQTSFVTPLLQAGYAVAETDYPRSPASSAFPNDLMYMMRLPQSHAVLDAVRAAQRLPGSGLSTSAPVGIDGYSEGGAGAAGAAELAPTYAPDLHVVGAYAGAVPADLKAVAQSLEGSFYFGFEAMAIIGANAAYPEANIPSLLNATGIQAYQSLDQDCTLNGLLGFLFQRTSSYTTSGLSLNDYLNMPQYAPLAADQTIGKLKPTVPVEVESAPNDDVIPNAQVVTMAKSWCSLGATVQYNNINGQLLFTHLSAAGPAATDAVSWLSARFAGTPTSGNCGQF